MIPRWSYITHVGIGRFFWRTLIRQFAKRVLRCDLNMRLPTGPVLNLPRASQAASEIFVTGADVDWGSEGVFLRYLDRQGCVLDVGANIGYYTLLCAPLVRAVYAFEPDARNWPALERNAARAANVTIVREAVHRLPGEMALDVSGDPAVSRLVAADAGSATRRTPVTTIDLFVEGNETGPVTAIKIDVEGEDLAVLQGAEATLAGHAPLVLTEFTRDPGAANDFGALFDLLDRRGYAAHAFVPSNVSRGLKTSYRLIRLDRETIAAFPFKMLFLVPPRLAAAFAAGGEAGGVRQARP
jgi:FkbM family methyltransferase